jgi:cell division protein FtsI/penicillin-binding protein 2
MVNEVKKDEKMVDIDIVQKQMNRRISFIQGSTHIAFAILIIYLFTIQVLDFNNYKERGIAIRNSSGITLRGNILDRNGLKLATDVLVYEIYAHPSLYSEKRSVEDIAELLWPYLGTTKDELIEKLKSKKINMITLKKDVDKATADRIRRLGLREISVGTLSKRLYPQGSIASHILGYYSHLSKNSVGIENIASQKLTNVMNPKNIQRTASGQIIFDLNTDLKQVVELQKGEDVKLTIDTSIQYVCEKELAKTIKEKKAERGSVIVMNPKNGEILAYASYPTFDPNTFWKYPQSNMKNWSLTDIYPPGSTFKIITVATAMELGKINEHSKIQDTGRMVVDRFPIENYDYKKNPNPGNISLEYLFEHSSNVGSANIALMLEPQEYYSKLRDFSFGQKTGIDLTAESIGLLPKAKNWYKSRRASMGYGYGASVTAIQMISAVSAIANNGLWITPHVMKYSNEEMQEHIETRQVISEENAKIVTKLLAKSIQNGNTVLNLKNYTVAAKTGTSRKQVSSGKEVYASAIGYFPASSPRVAIYVVIDSPKTGADWGSTIAAPLFKDIAEEVGKLLNIPSDK